MIEVSVEALDSETGQLRFDFYGFFDRFRFTFLFFIRLVSLNFFDMFVYSVCQTKFLAATTCYSMVVPLSNQSMGRPASNCGVWGHTACHVKLTSL